MYHIAASLRFKAARSFFAVAPAATELLIGTTTRLPKHATASLSFYATGSSTTAGSSGSSSVTTKSQHRPFWGSTPQSKVNDMKPFGIATTGPTMVNTIDHAIASAAATAGIPLEDVKKAKKPKAEKKPKKKKEATAENKGEQDAAVPEAKVATKTKSMPVLEKDFVGVDYMSKVIAFKHDLTASQARKIVDEVFDIVSRGVIENDQVRIPNFGIFSKAISKEKTLKSIQTKEVYQVPAKFRATFKVSSVLRAKVSELPLPSGVTVAKK